MVGKLLNRQSLFYRLNPDHTVTSVPDSSGIQPIEERRVALTELPNASISTVFLSLNHNFSDEGDPILFETMVFRKSGEGERGDSCDERRYRTWTEAMAGHDEMVDEWLEPIPDWRKSEPRKPKRQIRLT